MRWRAEASREDVWIVRAFEALGVPSDGAIPPDAAALRVDDWFPEGSASRRVLADICSETAGLFRVGPQTSTAWLRERVREALRSGRLVAHRIPRQAFGISTVEIEPEPITHRAAPREEKTWIVLELMDDADPPRPVPFKRYRIELPDESTREGRLDANGRAHIAGIDPGTCKVTFPDFHADDWKPG